VRLSLAQRNSLEEAVSHYERLIDGAATYLAGRGITKDAAVTRRLGYVAPGNALIGQEQYEGRLVIPYLSPAGVVDIRFRNTDPASEAPKYMGRPGVETLMYGVLAFQRDTDIIAVCEGEMDALVLEELVGIPAVGVPGANSWKSYYWRCFEDYSKVFVFADGDQAGRDFAKRVAQSVDQTVIVQMPEGHDVNSLFVAEGAESLRKRAGLE
jgi:DNA primase